MVLPMFAIAPVSGTLPDWAPVSGSAPLNDTADVPAGYAPPRPLAGDESVTMSVEPTELGPDVLSDIGIRSIWRIVRPATVIVHAYIGPVVAAATVEAVAMICTAVAVVLVSLQLNAASVVVATRVTVSEVGAMIDAVPAADGMAEPLMVMAGTCVAVPAGMVVMPVIGTLAADIPVDCAVAAAVTRVSAGSVVAVGSVITPVVSVIAAAVPVVAALGALSIAVSVTGVVVVPPDSVHE
jgi:hypothetical protein